MKSFSIIFFHSRKSKRRRERIKGKREKETKRVSLERERREKEERKKRERREKEERKKRKKRKREKKRKEKKNIWFRKRFETMEKRYKSTLSETKKYFILAIFFSHYFINHNFDNGSSLATHTKLK